MPRIFKRPTPLPRSNIRGTLLLLNLSKQLPHNANVALLRQVTYPFLTWPRKYRRPRRNPLLLLQGAVYPSPVIVPNVVGLQADVASLQITNAFLNPSVVLVPTFIPPDNQVLSQDPVAGTPVGYGTVVTLQVADLYAYVPDVTGLTQSDAQNALTAAGFTYTVTLAPASGFPPGTVSSQAPIGGTGEPIGFAVVISVVPIVEATVPNVIGETLVQATLDIQNAGLAIGTVTLGSSATVPFGNIAAQSIPGNSLVPFGTVVNLVQSIGAQAIVPDVTGLSPASANALISGVGLTVASVTPAHSDSVPLGRMISQDPLGGSFAPLGSDVALILSIGPEVIQPGTFAFFSKKAKILAPFDFEATVISQYANSPTILRLVRNFNSYINQDANFKAFFDYVWNVDSAQGFGLSILGRIVGVSRLLRVINSGANFGFDTPLKSYTPFNVAPFYSGDNASDTFTLTDEAYRVVVLAKALSNISSMTIPALNQLLMNLFGSSGRCYVQDLGNMQMNYVFEFTLTNLQYAIITQSTAVPHPAGVLINIIQPVI